MTRGGFIGGHFTHSTKNGLGYNLPLHAMEYGVNIPDCYSGKVGKKGLLEIRVAEFGLWGGRSLSLGQGVHSPCWGYARDGRPGHVNMEWAGGDRMTAREKMEKDKGLKEGAESGRPEKPNWADEDNMVSPNRPISLRRNGRWPTDLEQAQEALPTTDAGEDGDPDPRQSPARPPETPEGTEP